MARTMVAWRAMVLALAAVAAAAAARGEAACAAAGPLAADGPEARRAAHVALAELRRQSESGVFETLELAGVRSARRACGRFYDNVVLECELSSPAGIELGPGEETFVTEFVVMHDRETGEVRSVAVDRLPRFPEAVMASMKAERAKEQQRDRAAYFDELEARELAAEVEFLAAASSEEVDAELAALGAQPLRRLLGTSGLTPESQAAVQRELDRRLDALEMWEAGASLNP